jgi:hypothetical protein
MGNTTAPDLYYSSWNTMGTDTFTIDTSTISDTTLTYSSYVDQTPTDPVELAELKLAGICPKCRAEDGHEWNCEESLSFTDISTYATSGNLTFNSSVNTSPVTITVGNATLTEDKINRLNVLLDAFTDEEINDLIVNKLQKG